MKNITGADLSKLILKTTNVYNRYGNPESTAKLLKMEKDSVIIEVEGPYCQNCGT